MSTDTPASDFGNLNRSQAKPQRVLACLLCQRRKLKCDRKFPCESCVKSKSQCVPATQVRQRKRRFPERELLDRVRKYEELLRKNHVKFDPLHKASGLVGKGNSERGSESDEEQPQVGSPGSESAFEAKSIWHAMSHESPDHGIEPRVADFLETTITRTWDQLADEEHMLFGKRNTSVDLSTFHPDAVNIFRLWQVYVDNVNPLLKVTHPPSLQGRIIEAAANVKNMQPAFEALLFGIYSISVLSLTQDECQTMLGSAQDDLLTKYHFGCQQALMNANFLSSVDRDCLTALFLYLLSVKSGTNPRFLCSMLGVAIRIAQLMGINSEAVNSKHDPFEAEMRRRVWWALVQYDARTNEKSGQKDTTLSPVWDCTLPVNINDPNLRPGMMEPPTGDNGTTDAIFMFVRSQLADFQRHTPWHLNFTNPALRPIAKALPSGGSLDALERRVESEFLRICDLGNPLHFMTVWTARALIAKFRLQEHFARSANAHFRPTDEQRGLSLNFAFGMLECDSVLLTSPLTQRYRWFTNMYFPFPAYIHVVQELRARPLSNLTGKAWEVMSDNADVRIFPHAVFGNPIFKMLCRVTLLAWEACEEAAKSEIPLEPPRIVSGIRQKEAEAIQAAKNAELQIPEFTNSEIDEFLATLPSGLGGNNSMFGTGGPNCFVDGSPTSFPMTSQPPMVFGMGHLNWSNSSWNAG